MSPLSAREPAKSSLTITAILGAILVLAEIPIQLMEHAHFFADVKNDYPRTYAFMTSQEAAFVRWVVGILMIICVIVEHRRHRLHSGEDGQEGALVQAPASPSITISPTFNSSATLSPTISGHAARGVVKTIAEETRPFVKSNFVFLRARAASVKAEASEGREQFYESRVRDQDDPVAIIACFRNESSVTRRVMEADNVRAQIIYRNSSGEEVGDGVPRACWLGDPMDLIDFRVGDSHCAIVLLVSRDGICFAPWKRRARSAEGYGEIVTTEAHDFSGESIKTAEIRLLSETNELLMKPVMLEFSIVDGVPHFVTKQD